MMRSRPTTCRLSKLSDLIEADGFFQQGLIGKCGMHKCGMHSCLEAREAGGRDGNARPTYSPSPHPTPFHSTHPSFQAHVPTSLSRL